MENIFLMFGLNSKQNLHMNYYFLFLLFLLSAILNGQQNSTP